MTLDALVVGGGPSGCAAAIALARAGHRTTLIDRSAHHDASWASLVTSDALQALADLGATEHPHPITQLRLGDRQRHAVRTLETGTLAALRRPLLDAALVNLALQAGVDVLSGTEAQRPVVERGFLRGAEVVGSSGEHVLTAEYVIIADGANSTFGRALGTHRRRDRPYLTCARGTWSSALSRVVECEVLIGLRRPNHDDLPGHALVVPDGHGAVTVTVHIPSTARDAAAINPAGVLDDTVRAVAERWAINPDDPIGEVRSARLPVGQSVGPVAGPTFLVVGDAAASADPLTGLGLGPALTSGALAGELVAAALATGASAPLQAYVERLNHVVGRRQRRSRALLQLFGRETGNRAVRHALHALAAASTSR